VTSAAKAADENKPFIAAVNGCATQNQVQHGVCPQPLKPRPTQTWLVKHAKNPIDEARSNEDQVVAEFAKTFTTKGTKDHEGNS